MKLTKDSNKYLYVAILAVVCLFYAIFTLSKTCYELGYIKATNEINRTK